MRITQCLWYVCIYIATKQHTVYSKKERKDNAEYSEVSDDSFDDTDPGKSVKGM